MAGKVGKWIAIGCGGVLVLGLAGGAALYFLVWRPAKTKLMAAGVNFSGDAKQLASSLLVAGLKQAQPRIMQALPTNERAEVEAALTQLDRHASKLKPEDFKQLGDAFQAFTQAAKTNGGTPTPEAAHQLGEDLKRIAARLKES